MAKSSGDSEKKRPSLWFEWVKSLVIAVGIALLIRWPIIEPFQIPSGSMEPTFVSGDRIFVNKYVYGVRWPFNGFRIPFTRTTIWYSEGRMLPGVEPERFDIVVFKSVEHRVEKDTLVKRIVGLPGERIHIPGDGTIIINGERLEIPPEMPSVHYTNIPPPFSEGYGILRDDEHAVVPEDHYFLLGDNSGHSRDARWFGFVPNHHLLGRVSSIWWPVPRWRDFTGYTDTLWWNLSLAILGMWTVTRLFVARSWRAAEPIADIVARGDRVVVRYSLGLPVPFTRFRIGQGRPINRGDLVLYRSPQQEGIDPDFLLGIVGGQPGQKVSIKQNALHINGEPAQGLPDALTLAGESGKFGLNKAKEFSNVPEDEYYLLSDAAEGSQDSRTLGWIPRHHIVGHVSRIWWPMPRAQRLNRS